MIIPEWLFRKTNENKILYNLKPSKQLSREKNKLDDKELAKHLINPY